MTKLVAMLILLGACLLIPHGAGAAEATAQEAGKELGAILAWRLGPEAIEERCRSADPEGAQVRKEALNTWLTKNEPLIQAVNLSFAPVDVGRTDEQSCALLQVGRDSWLLTEAWWATSNRRPGLVTMVRWSWAYLWKVTGQLRWAAWQRLRRLKAEEPDATQPALWARWVEEEVGRKVGATVTRERRQVEGRHARALESLSASVAHEIRNPVTAAKSLVQQIAEDPTSTTNAEYARVAAAELDRVERSVSHLLRYAREEPLTLAETDLEDVVRGALETDPERPRAIGG